MSQFTSKRHSSQGTEPLLFAYVIWATSWENLFMPNANNKGAGQPVHPCSLISAFVVRCLDSITLGSISEISSLHLASVDAQAGLSYLVANPDDRFSCDKAHNIWKKRKLQTKSLISDPIKWLGVHVCLKDLLHEASVPFLLAQLNYMINRDLNQFFENYSSLLF